jgi:hypothetical protein
MARVLGVCIRAAAHRGHPDGHAHERTRTLHGSVCPDDVGCSHGGASVACVAMGPRQRAPDSKWGGL